MPEVPRRTDLDRVLTPVTQQAQDPALLEAEFIAKGNEQVGTATAGFLMKMAEARKDAAANHALTQGFGVLNRAQHAANQSTDYRSMQADFYGAYESSLEKILDGVPDDGTRTIVQNRLEQSYLTREMSIKQRALGLERQDHRAQLMSLGSEVAMMAASDPNSLTLKTDLASYELALKRGVAHDNISPEEAEKLMLTMMDTVDRSQLRYDVENGKALEIRQALQNPENYPHLLPGNRLRAMEALTAKDQADAYGSVALMLSLGKVDPGGIPIERYIDKLVGQKRLRESQRGQLYNITKNVRRQLKRDTTDLERAKQMQTDPLYPFVPGNPQDMRGADLIYAQSHAETFFPEEIGMHGPPQERTTENQLRHDLEFMIRTRMVAPKIALSTEGLLNSTNAQALAAGAKQFVFARINGLGRQFGLPPHLEDKAERIVESMNGGSTAEEAMSRYNDHIDNHGKASTERLLAQANDIIMEGVEDWLGEPSQFGVGHAFENTFLDTMNDAVIEVDGQPQEIGNLLRGGGFGGIVLDLIEDGTRTLDTQEINPELFEGYRRNWTEAFVRSGNERGSHKEARDRMLAAGWAPTWHSGRFRMMKDSPEHRHGSINGSFEWIPNEIERSFLEATGLTEEDFLQNGLTMFALSSFKGAAAIADSFTNYLSHQPEEGDPVQHFRGFIKSWFKGDLAGPHVWLETSKRSGIDSVPRYQMFFMDDDKMIQKVQMPGGGQYDFIFDKEGSPEWAANELRRKTENADDVDRLENTNAREDFREKWGVYPEAALGIMRGQAAGAQSLNWAGTAARLSDPALAEAKAIVQTMQGHQGDDLESAGLFLKDTIESDLHGRGKPDPFDINDYMRKIGR